MNERIAYLRRHFADFVQHYRLVWVLGWNDVQQTYKRSKLGAFWISIGSGVGILTISVVYGLIFKIELDKFLPYISTSVILWNLIASSISESSMAYSNAEPMIKQIKLPLKIYNFRVILRNLAIAGHNFVMIPIVYLLAGFSPGFSVALFPLSLVVVVANLGWISIVVALASTRFRDLGPTVANLLQIAFYVTPVIWLADAIPSGLAHLLLGLNPFYHWLQVLRLPLLGQVPTLENWIVTTATAVLGWAMAIPLFEKFKRSVALWL